LKLPFIIAGPTAVGKSEIAVALAERCGGEIVGADAFQVYAGLDLLTAKPSPELRARVPHHLVGTVPLTQRWDVAQYLAEAQRCIADIRARGRVPIVCGGTGLYVRALTHGLAELPAADAVLREELERQPLEELQRRLAELDPQGAARIDLQNPRRVIRALEVCLLTGRPFSGFREQWAAPAEGVRGVFLTRDRAELSEVGPTAEQTLGLREIRALLGGEVERGDCVAAIQQATRRYAKRQFTWFRRETGLTPMNLTGRPDLATVVAEIASLAKP
jgi:tRNA dimethylallyltransferase